MTSDYKLSGILDGAIGEKEWKVERDEQWILDSNSNMNHFVTSNCT
jgi:hypothetical protein